MSGCATVSVLASSYLERHETDSRTTEHVYCRFSAAGPTLFSIGPSLVCLFSGMEGKPHQRNFAHQSTELRNSSSSRSESQYAKQEYS